MNNHWVKTFLLIIHLLTHLLKNGSSILNGVCVCVCVCVTYPTDWQTKALIEDAASVRFSFPHLLSLFSISCWSSSSTGIYLPFQAFQWPLCFSPSFGLVASDKEPLMAAGRDWTSEKRPLEKKSKRGGRRENWLTWNTLDHGLDGKGQLAAKSLMLLGSKNWREKRSWRQTA